MDTVPAPTEALRVAMTDAAVDIDRALDMLIPPSEGAEARLFDAMRYAAMGGGKRLRGFLVLECARQFSVGRDTALRTAAAIEMLHAYSLVHDDLPCMDDDDLRRGKPTVHKAFDEATAVLAGDACRPMPSTSWPNPTPMPTRPYALNCAATWRALPARAACAAGR